MTKQCSRCKQIKNSDCFGNSRNTMDGKRFDCKECRKKVYYENQEEMLNQKRMSYIKHKGKRLSKMKQLYSEDPEYYKQKSNEYYKNNKEKILERSKEYRAKNAEVIKQRKAEYYQRPEVRSHATIKNREWKRNNPEKRRAMEKRYFDKDPIRKIIRGMRTRIFTVLKRKGAHKAGHTIKQLGCTPEFLKQHLESQFHSYVNELGETIEMSWDKFGNGPGTFQVDHIVALCLFNLDNEDEQLIANHWTNLQPLWFHDHNIKSQQDLELKQMFERAGKLPTQSLLTT